MLRNISKMKASLRRVADLLRRPHVIYLGDHEVLTELHSGHRIYLDTRDVGIAAHIMWRGEWESWIERVVIYFTKPGMQVADIGANFGYYTLLMATAVGPTGRVHSFEANPALFDKLRRSVYVNGLETRVSLSSLAVAAENGTAEFTFDPAFSGGGSLIGGYAPSKVVVETRRLDDAIGPDTDLDFMKIDVEGAEPLVVQGANRLFGSSRLRHVVLEFFAPGIAATRPPLDFLSELEAFGFVIHVINKNSTWTPFLAADLLNAYSNELVYLLLVRR